MWKWLRTLPLLAFAWPGYGTQAPFHAHTSSQTTKTQWNLNERPDVNATDNLIFATASSFLQHWPNTRYRNGHNIVPGTVAPGTLLYHGRFDSSLPSGPEWTATDPEHSLHFCWGTKEGGCWHLTIAATRPLRVLYFDGTSAGKMPDGPMDTQDIVAWGLPAPDQYRNERERIRDLCDWGKEFEIDGFVRMEVDFEIMLCNFTNGVETVSMLNLHVDGPRLPRLPLPKATATASTVNHSQSSGLDSRTTPSDPPPMSPEDRRRGPPLSTKDLETSMAIVISGKWHDRYPGEQRIQLDYSQLISFYDTDLVPTLIEERFRKSRLEHRLKGMSQTDAHNARKRLEEVLKGELGAGGSGVDWSMLLQVTVDRFAARLEDLQYYLNSTSPSLENAYGILKTITHPYRLHTAIPPSLVSPPGHRETPQSHSWAEPVYELCATTHTAHLLKLPNLTCSEKLLLNATMATNKEICRVTVRLWAEGYESGLDSGSLSERYDVEARQTMAERWRQDIDGLMAWLDWSVWLKCKPACDYESICYLPTWPFFYFDPSGRLPGPRKPGDPDKEQIWKDPQPKCIRRIDTFTGRTSMTHIYE